MKPESVQVGDIVSLGVVVGVVQQWLPALASLLAIIWTAIRIYEWVRWRLVQRRREPFE